MQCPSTIIYSTNLSMKKQTITNPASPSWTGDLTGGFDSRGNGGSSLDLYFRLITKQSAGKCYFRMILV